MANEITTSADQVWRDYETDGVPSSGAHDPLKSAIRAHALVVETSVAGAAEGLIVYATWAELDAVAGTADGQPGRVTGTDAGTHTEVVAGAGIANVGEYRWDVGNAEWIRVSALREATIAASEAAALVSETASAASAALSAQWAEEVEDTPVTGAQYSSLHWAAKAAASASLVSLGGAESRQLTKRIPVIVYWGESNSGGYADNSDLAASKFAERPAVQIFNNTTFNFESLILGYNGTTEHSSLTGPGILVSSQYAYHGFEAGLANQVEGGEFGSDFVYLVKLGQGGSKVSEWAVGGVYFETARKRLERVRDFLEESNVEPWFVLHGSIGINDAGAGTATATFESSLIAILKTLWDVIGYRCPSTLTGLTTAYPTYATNFSNIASSYKNVTIIDTTTANANLKDAEHWDYLGMELIADAQLAAVASHITAINYDANGQCPFDPQFSSKTFLKSADNTQVINAAGAPWIPALGTVGRSSGKFYYEFTNTVGTSNAPQIGFGKRDFSLIIQGIPNTAAGIPGTGAFVQANTTATTKASMFTEGTALGTAASQTTGAWNGIAVDMDAGKAWFNSNGTWNGDPAAGTNPWITWTPGSDLFYPMIIGYATHTTEINATTASLNGSVPSGFSVWGDDFSHLAPANLNVPFIVGSRQDGSELRCETGDWDGSAPMRFIYQWYRDGAAIIGGTGKTFKLTVGDVGTDIKCKVTAVNRVGGAIETTTAFTVYSSAAVRWNSGKSSRYAIFSNSDLDFTGTSEVAEGVVGNFGHSSGQIYYEINIVTGADLYVFVGVCDGSLPPVALHNSAGTAVGRSAAVRSDGFAGASGMTYNAASLGTTVTGRVLGLAIDVDAKKVWISNNNAWILGDPAAGTSPSITWTKQYTILPFARLPRSSEKLRIISSGFTYTPPTGFAGPV
tara:strand:+ start:3114 stop:5843 length:2730 start_codon:yes stop_codon:yes gene_type:complete